LRLHIPAVEPNVTQAANAETVPVKLVAFKDRITQFLKKLQEIPLWVLKIPLCNAIENYHQTVMRILFFSDPKIRFVIPSPVASTGQAW
jgi:hypothetical protein